MTKKKNELIVEILDTYNLSPNELVKILGCSIGTFNSWYYCRRVPSKAIVKFLEVIKLMGSVHTDLLTKMVEMD